MIFNIFIILVGLAFLILGAELVVRSASNIAKKFYIPEILIGLTIVSIGTSIPELIITIKSAFKGSTDLILGNAIGSNLCNLLLILGIMGLIKPIYIQEETKKFHIPIAFFATTFILIISILKENRVINSFLGVILIILFIAYIIYPILLDKKRIAKEYKKAKENKVLNNGNIFFQLFIILLGLILLKQGGDLVVNRATIIAENYGLSERVIGLTIVAIGTALPELITSIVSTISNNTDIGIGNLIGSSMVNFFLILGIGATIVPIKISEKFIENLFLLTFANILIWSFCYIPKKNIITRIKAFSLVGIFAIYLINLLI